MRFFRDDPLKVDDDQVLADLMAATWLGALKQIEPARSWRTMVLSPAETGGTWGVGFVENAPVAP
jgi:hypothetical protein